jgi:hypothetical protein
MRENSLARSLACLLAWLEKEDAAPFSTATTGKPLSKSDKVTNTIDDIYDYDFSVVDNEYFYAVANAYFKRADLIV